jgi:hypothetical protein
MMSEGMSVGAKTKDSTADVKAGKTRTLVGGAIGHFIEWYDWAIYGWVCHVGEFYWLILPSKGVVDCAIPMT